MSTCVAVSPYGYLKYLEISLQVSKNIWKNQGQLVCQLSQFIQRRNIEQGPKSRALYMGNHSLSSAKIIRNLALLSAVLTVYGEFKCFLLVSVLREHVSMAKILSLLSSLSSRFYLDLHKGIHRQQICLNQSGSDLRFRLEISVTICILFAQMHCSTLRRNKRTKP